MKVTAGERAHRDRPAARLVFAVKAYDETRPSSARGKHERFIVDMDKFTAKCEAKMAK